MSSPASRNSNSFGAWVALAIVGALVLALMIGCLSFFFLGVRTTSVSTHVGPAPAPASAPPPTAPEQPAAPEER